MCSGKVVRLAVAGALVLALGACEEPTQAEILAKATGVTDREALLDAIGKPDSISRTGAMEIWRYDASDGVVCYAAGGRLLLRVVC